jgi:hypothetical protein
MTGTYGLALATLFLCGLNEPTDQATIRQLAMRLAAGQGNHGGWGYACPPLSPDQSDQLAQFFKELGRQSLADYLKDDPQRLKRWPDHVRLLASLQPQHPTVPYYRLGDNSNTQFATLALWAARRREAPLDFPLQLIALRFRHSQNPNGSWSYSGNAFQNHLPTMTCAGLLGMAVGYGLVPADAPAADPRKDPIIQNGLANLAPAVGAPGNERQPYMTDMYFLWSVERVAVLYQLPLIGGKDWYRWGLRMLRANQRADGSWSANLGHGATGFTDTCFALLFLQRVNFVQDLTDKLNEAIAAVAPRLDGAKQ